jgi:hypothetical protein
MSIRLAGIWIAIESADRYPPRVFDIGTDRDFRTGVRLMTSAQNANPATYAATNAAERVTLTPSLTSD